MITTDGLEAWRSLLGLIYPRMRTQIGEAAQAVGISPGALRALMLIEPGEGIAMGELAERWGCDPSYITTLADDLEESGLAHRVPKPNDRRSRMLVLTSDGVDARERVRETFTAPPAALAKLSANEQRDLRRILAKLAPDEQTGALFESPRERRAPRRAETPASS
ncbi:MAG: MarR family transcriptional regulator [Dehalococcoidia bacterium]